MQCQDSLAFRPPGRPLLRKKAVFVYIGAALMTASLLIMAALTGSKDQMARFLAPGAWCVISSLLAPIGFVLQDAVADAMTVEAQWYGRG